uniref:Growth arrest and DNA damage inducible beta n=1 Tax=Monodelphis domestica TaxID=13616 RepID=A0A5F8GZ31_MONDO
MTLEEVVACESAAQKMQTVSNAVEELLVAAQRQDRLTVGVYESAKLMNVDPDSVVLCLLAIDEDEEDDIALQIHFTLIQAFCCDNDIDIVRVSGMRRLAELLGEPGPNEESEETRDLHCLLVTVGEPGPSWLGAGLLSNSGQIDWELQGPRSERSDFVCQQGSPEEVGRQGSEFHPLPSGLQRRHLVPWPAQH